MQGTILALALGSSLALAQSGQESEKPAQVSVRGRVLVLEESDHLLASGQDGVKRAPQYGLQTSDGELYRFLRTDPLTKMFSDPRVRERKIQITARLLAENQLEIIRIHTVEGKSLYKIFYYCDVCGIMAFEPGSCYCCHKEFELREDPVTNLPPSSPH